MTFFHSVDSAKTAEERRHWLSRPIRMLYACMPRRLRTLLRRLAALTEGGEMTSATLRDIMRLHHGVEIGLHSYGCFDPDRIAAGCRIGRYVSVGPGVRAFRRNHPTDRISLHPYFYNTALGLSDQETIPATTLTIAEDVWVGANAVLLPGCKQIGRGAVIGACSVVTHDVPAYSVVAGNPARHLRDRFPKPLQQKLQDSQWWNRSRAELAKLLPLLQQPATEQNVDSIAEGSLHVQHRT